MKETHYKLKHRVTALFAAAVMLCSMLPGAAFAEEPTPQPTEETVQMEQQTEPSETDNGQTDESSPDPGEDVTEATPETAEEQPAEEEISAAVVGAELYTDLPDAPIGSYIGSEGLPVATGETKIGICEWPESQLEETSDSYLTAAALDNDGLTMAAPLLDGADYAIVPIMAQVEYPADGSTLDLVLPDGVTLLDYYGTPVEDAESLLHNEYSETSAAVLGVYVQADADFTAQLVYTAPDGSALTKTLQVTIDRNVTAEYPFPDSEIATFAERPTPAVTSGKITKVAKVNGTWLIWFNGEPAYCCTHGANGQPAGCPTYTYVNTSTVNADQCIPGDHYGNQIRIWGGLNQLALSDAEDLPAVFSADEGEEISLLDFCASIYDDVQMYVIENFPESTAAEIYLASADELLNGVETYASARGYYTYIYNPGRAGWQTVALIGPEIGEEEPEPEPVVQEYYASWEAPAQTASGSFDFSYGIRADKIQLKTQEKVDGATIEIEPITKSGSIDGGSWSISPASKQTVTTSGHTADDNYQKNGGDASASWSLHYSVTKTSGTRNGQVGPFTTQEAADEAANSARDAAIAELQAEAQNAVNAAVNSAKNQLGSLQFRYEEISVPYGFEKYWGSNGSQQTITVPANTNNDYVMKNDEWSLQVNLKKTDSETGSQIAADAQYEIYQWDVVTGKYQPTGGYNTYSVQRQGDGTYAVINSAAYATTDAMRHTLYYTQRNQGKFILVETKGPTGYFGDWTDIDHPGTAGTPLGKRAYYIEITEANDNAVLWLDNADYNADILTADKGGTKLVTGGGVETTVRISNVYKNYRMENGAPKLVRMTDTVNGHLTKNVTTFYTNAEGILTLPEKLPLGKYRIVETTAPNGYYNAWADDASHYVDFTITTDRIYQATGDKNENGMDTLVIGEKYANHETLGKLTIRKTGEVLTGWQSEPGGIDLWMTGEAENGNFTYETRPLAGAEYTITAAEDIYTQDRQLDNYGNRTLWYAKGDVVAVVTTGDGTADTAVFAPARTAATYDFLSVIHDGTIGEVSVTLPLGSYHIEETKPPYGYIGTTESYDVTFAWDNELNDVVMATSIAKADGAASSQSFEIVRSKDANADFTEQQTLKFHNDREKAKVGVYKVDRETGKYLAGAVFNLYAADDIYSVDGKLLFAAGELVATSPETGADGYTYFDCNIPIRGEYYGSSIRKDATTNSGNYIVKELRAPLGYYVNEEPMEVTFTYDGQAIMVLDNTCANKPTEMWVSKRALTNDEELPGATLAIKDTDGNTVTTWVSTDEPHRVTGLHFGESYTLTEIRAADGYALANDITFRLIQKSDEDGNHLEECEVYYLTTKNILFWKWDDWKLLDDATVIMQDDITKVQISKKDLTTNEELPGAELIITDEKGSEIDRWISTDAPHHMEKLPAGEYTLTEVTAPDGYAIAERMEFEVLPNGEVQTFEMFDDTIKVKISKVDITTNEELPGAELVIKDKDGTEIDRWISTNGPHYVEKMPAGDYTLTEITAPNGYKVAESIDFTVLPTGEMQTVVMKDAREDTPTPTPDNTPTPDHTPQPTPNTTPAPTPVPAAPTATPTPLLTIPKTGDNSSLGLLLAIAGISLAGLAVLVHKSARRKDIAPRDDDDEDTED